jgi:excisionase family DNA binding protein
MNRALQALPSLDTPRAPEPPSSVVVNGLGDELLTVNDAARLLHVTVSWVYEHTRDDAEDRLPFVKLGKYVRFDRTDLREYIDAKRRASRSGARRR